MSEGQQIGYVVGGGLKEGLRVRLTVSADDVQEGSFVVCESGRFRFYGLVTDLQLGATDPRFADEKTDRLPAAIGQAVHGKTLYTTLAMYPTLMQDLGPQPGTAAYELWRDALEEGDEQAGLRPVKTVPAHHAAVRLASEQDVAEIFAGGAKPFVIGHTIEQGYPVGLDLDKLVKRSSGIFGATGTGKSFLTRIVLAGLMREDVAAALVFDMHNEYGFDDRDTDREASVRGLKSLFGEKVQVASLGAGTLVRGHTADFNLQLALSDFTTNDILLLVEQLNLTDTAAQVLGALERDFDRNWFASLMKLEPGAVITDDEDKTFPAPNSVEAWARSSNVHPKAAETLHGRLRRIYDRDYVVEKPAADAVTAIVDYLDAGRHVILSFGKHDHELDYLLVTNILTRKIRERWIKKTETYKGGLEKIAEPRPLVIAVEEAHKLLSPAVARQTAFGVIAREMRKYYVTLLIVDQRPSGIDDEVMSQLGTRITGWLGDEDDIRAVLTGLAGREQLRGMLARLKEKEEVLLLGWGVKMPIPVRSRRYDKEFYADMRRGSAGRDNSQPSYTAEEANRDLF